MAITYVKRAAKSPATGEEDTRAIVAQMLTNIEQGGEDRCAQYARELDQFNGNIVVTQDEISAAGERLSQRVKDDIRFAHERVSKFALHQRNALTDFEVELSPGLWAGQRQIPVQTAGCYVPGGRYAHVASAVMSVATGQSSGCQARYCLLTTQTWCWCE